MDTIITSALKAHIPCTPCTAHIVSALLGHMLSTALYVRVGKQHTSKLNNNARVTRVIYVLYRALVNRKSSATLR